MTANGATANIHRSDNLLLVVFALAILPRKFDLVSVKATLSELNADCCQSVKMRMTFVHTLPSIDMHSTHATFTFSGTPS